MIGYSGTVSPLIGYGVQGSLAFGANELFKDLITYLDPNNTTQASGIMPMSHVLLSGVLTGVVSTLALVILLLCRLLLTTFEYSFRRKCKIGNTKVRLMRVETSLEDMEQEDSTWVLPQLSFGKCQLMLYTSIHINMS